jgi:sulfur relay (sulfurtransferase) DsrF/TusC family protein
MYDINNVYVVEEDLKELGLKTEDLIIGTKLLSRAELVYLLHGADIKLVY